MTEREQKILEIVCEIIRSGISVDTEADQNYVCDLIHKRVAEIV